MIDPLSPFSLPRQRVSKEALLLVALLHLGVLWWAWQNAPAAVRATRQVVMQYFSPITPQREKPRETPTLKVTENLPPPPVKPKPEPKAEPVTPPPAPVPPPPVPVPPPPTPAPILQKMEPIAAPRATFKTQDIKATPETKRTQELPTQKLEQVTSPVPVLPTLETLPPPTKTAPPPEPMTALPQSAPAPLPELASVPAPVPAVQVAAPPPAPAPSPVATQAPAPVPGAAVRPAAITPTEQRPASTAPAGSGAAGVAQPQNPGGPSMLNYNTRPNVASGRQKTAAEMAREQLNGNGTKNQLANDMNAAERPECLDSGGRGSLLSAAVIAYNVLKDKCK